MPEINYGPRWRAALATNDNPELAMPYRTDDVDRVESPTDEELGGEIEIQERIAHAKRLAMGRPLTAAVVRRQLAVLFPGQTRLPTPDETQRYRSDGEDAA